MTQYRITLLLIFFNCPHVLCVSLQYKHKLNKTVRRVHMQLVSVSWYRHAFLSVPIPDTGISASQEKRRYMRAGGRSKSERSRVGNFLFALHNRRASRGCAHLPPTQSSTRQPSHSYSCQQSFTRTYQSIQ